MKAVPDMKRLFVVVLAVAMLSVPCGPALADSAARSFPAQNNGMDDVPVIIDVLILRPVGLAACVVGLAAAVIAMPFALPSNSTDKVYRALIADPFHYTFRRPLGRSMPRK
jgi:hypothetical protein